METREYIPVTLICEQYEVEISFLQTLNDYGLLEIIQVNENACIHPENLERAEKLIRLHDSLELNPEGIDVVSHLLDRIEDMQNEILQLKNRLRFYED
ncbi:MAG: chaperone modulator CbpM [Bacteroidota bacterium]|nr:chaperone modulator CbpM [Bacteroidota bacterium]